MMKYHFYSLAFLICFSAHAQDHLKMDGDISAEAFWSQVAIYTIGDPIDFENLQTSFSKDFPDLKINTEQNDSNIFNGASLLHYKNAPTEFPPHRLEVLQYFAESLSDRQKQLLVKSGEAALIGIYGFQKDSWVLNKRLNQWIADYSKDKKWIIFDLHSIEYFTPEYWKSSRLDLWKEEHPRLENQISIHAYRKEAFCRAISVGMQKFGLPDIVVNDISCYKMDDMLRLINILAQQLASQPQVYKNEILIDLNKIKHRDLRDETMASIFENAKKKARINVKPAQREEGDPLNQLIEIDFSNPEYENPQLYQEYILTALFGSKDEMSFIDHSDALLKASKEATARLPKLKEQFQKGLEPGYSILLKAPFIDDDGSNEWMWIEVIHWESETIEGILQNEPYNIKKLKAGAKVKARQSDVFDYILYLPDGTYEGNTTGAIIQQTQGG